MKNETVNLEKTVGELDKRRETMPDGQRYIIYYTFGGEEKTPSEVSDNV